MPRIPTTARSRQTHSKILDAALELFNDRGTSEVTTNHIAAHAGISPGNLYYWFDDKTQIIRELHRNQVAEYDAMWGAVDSTSPSTLDELLALLTKTTVLTRRYVFLAREQLSLLRADPVLAQEYSAVRRRRIDGFVELVRGWQAAGLVKDIDDARINDILQATWIVSESWFALAELDPAPVDDATGARLLRVLLEPYLA